jgi:hypothetical protein
MKNFSIRKVLVSFILLSLVLFSFTDLTLDASAATKVKITQKTYKNSAIKYPQVTGLSNKSAQKKMNTAFTDAANTAYTSLQENEKEEKAMKSTSFCKDMPAFCNFNFEASYKIKYNAHGKLSVLYYEYAYTGGAHGLSNVTSYNFDINTGKRNYLNDVLKTKSNFSKIHHYLFNKTKNDSNLFIDNSSDLPLNKDTQFFYDHTGIFLIYQEYEIAPYSAGYPTLKVPSTLYKK